MITDLIKVNLQREVPLEHQAAILPQLQPQYLFSVDRLGPVGTGRQSTKGSVDDSLLVGDTTILEDRNYVDTPLLQDFELPHSPEMTMHRVKN